MAKTRSGETEPDAGALTHNPFAKLKAALPTGKAEAGTKPAAPASAQSAPQRARRVRVRQESRGHSGKVITRVAGLPLTGLQPIATRLRTALGCVATVEGEDVILEGSLAERLSAWLAAADLSAIEREATVQRVQRPIETITAESIEPAPIADGTSRSDVRAGRRVAIVMKADQESGKLTYGVVGDLLTSSPNHPRGIKVRLVTGEIGRVKSVWSE